jgi:hypothetical protein
MRTTQLGIMVMMMVVGTSPDATRTEDQDAENPHQSFGQAGVGQNRQVLLIVVNHEKTEDQKPGEKTAGNPAGRVEVPERSRKAARQQKSG